MRERASLAASSFVLLPLYPLAFAVLVIPLGLWRWVAFGETSPIKWFFLSFSILGALSQLFSPSIQSLDPSLTPSNQPHNTGSFTLPPNLILPYGLNCLYAWNVQDGAWQPKERLPDGFFRLRRTHPTSGREFSEYLCERQYPLEVGQSYTQSFLLRHDNSSIDLQISFATDQGHNPVPTQITDLGNGLKRVYGTYQARAGDRAVRAIDFLNMGGGDWTYLEVGFAQLEVGTTLTDYRAGAIAASTLRERVSWWIGTGLSSYLSLLGSRWLLSVVKPYPAAFGILIGLTIHFCITLYQYIQLPELVGRVQGLEIQPNFLGHMAIVGLGLVWLMADSVLTGLAVAVVLGLVFLSGSRAAMLGLIPVFVAIGWRLSQHKGWVMWTGALAVLVGLVSLSGLGRLGELVNLDATTNQTRLQIWSSAWQAWLKFPLTGVGLGNFPVFYQINLPMGALEFDVGHAHNLFFHFMAEAGLLGLLGFLLLWGACITHLVHLKAHSALLILLVVLILNLVDYTWYWAGVNYALWLAIAWGEQRHYRIHTQAVRMAG